MPMMPFVLSAFFLCLGFTLAAVVPQQQPLSYENAKAELYPAHDACEHNEYATSGNDTLHVSYQNPTQLEGLGLDPTSKQFSGYLATGDHRMLFFWLILSRSNRDTAPLVLWQNGGPGCSSLYGALRQWGPKIMDDKGRWVDNPALLNENANLLFVDAPVGVGFSTNERGFNVQVDRTPIYTQHMMSFLQLFFRTTFNGGGVTWNPTTSPFHIGGESFAGHYVPSLASAIVTAGNPYRLQSIFVGNGWFDALAQRENSFDMLCNDLFNPKKKWPMLSQVQCDGWRGKSTPCANALIKCRTLGGNACQYEMEACKQMFVAPEMAASIARDQYDLTAKLAAGADRNVAEGGALETWVSSKREIFGAAVGGWNMLVPRGGMIDIFKASGDWYFDYTPDLSNILSNSAVRVLLYAGDTDLMCPFQGSLQVGQNINWPGYQGFNVKATLTPYSKLRIGAIDYGEYVKESRLTYVRVYGAGHMINENKPQEAKNMITRWLENTLE